VNVAEDVEKTLAELVKEFYDGMEEMKKMGKIPWV
jgi:hypothetical protein